ncbi:MAG: patatin-like phospholipase family protein [Holosporaceae bacterium]|nr:patatin-like phospholipase family protein [Holosporaceae bacterium]
MYQLNRIVSYFGFLSIFSCQAMPDAPRADKATAIANSSCQTILKEREDAANGVSYAEFIKENKQLIRSCPSFNSTGEDHGWREHTRERALSNQAAISPALSSLRQDDFPVDTKLILSIDGGGSRGIIPLYYLREIKKILDKERLEVDMIAGTSAGALIGAVVAQGKEDFLYDNYSDFISRIFPKRRFSVGRFFKPKYASKKKSRIIKEFIEDYPENNWKTDLVIPFYSYRTGEAKIYKSYYPNNLNLHDVLMMTSAAPTYFEPHSCGSNKRDIKDACIGGDGGIFANHPGMAAYAEAKKKYPHSKIVMISLGTGKQNSYASTKHYHKRGLVFWASKFPDISIDSTSSFTDLLLESLSRADENFEYIRIQPRISKKIMKTDGISEDHIAKLVAAAMASISEGAPEYDRFNRVLQIFGSR